MDDIFIYLGYFILVINVILYTYSFLLLKKVNVFFLIYLWFSLVLQLSLEIMFHLNIENNLFAINIFFIGQMILLALFYESLFKFKLQKLFVKWSVGLALLILLIQYICDVGEFSKFNLLEIALTSLLVVSFALIHLFNMFSENKTYYYITIGIIIYLFASTVLFFIGNLTIGLSAELKYISWTFNAFLIIVNQFFILFEWKKSFSKKSIIKYEY